jgi:thioredoxin-related protein
MKNLILVSILLLLPLVLQAQINFTTGSWAEVKAKAQQENKMIFIDVYTVWCSPCKEMAKNVFTDKEVGDMYNAKFINYKLDAEKGEGIEFAKTYQIDAFPTLMYFSPKGELLHKTSGSRDASDFMGLGNTALDPEKQYYTLKKQFKARKNDKDFVRNFIEASKQAHDTEGLKELALLCVKILRDMPEEEWGAAENQTFVFEALTVEESLLPKVAKMRDDFERYMPKAAFNEYLLQTFAKTLQEAIDKKDETKIEEIRRKILQYIPQEETEMMILQLEEIYYLSTDQTEKAELITQKLVPFRQ